MDYRFDRNASQLSNLSCGRLDLTSDPPSWDPRDPHCDLRWDPDGLACVCDRPGAFALMWSADVKKVSLRHGWSLSVFRVAGFRREDALSPLSVSLQGWVLCVCLSIDCC